MVPKVPLQAPLHLFLTRYVEGKRVTEIAGELGVSRELREPRIRG